MIIPMLAIITSVLLTCQGKKMFCGGGPLCFTKFGVWALVLATILLALSTNPAIARVTDYTWFGHGQTTLRIYGFFVMTMLGAIYYILPLMVGANRVCERGMRINFWLVMPGTLIFSLPLLAAGITQGLKLINPSVPFLETTKATMMAFRISTLGETLLLLGNLLFLLNLGWAIFSYYRVLCKSAYEEATQLEPAGVKS